MTTTRKRRTAPANTAVGYLRVSTDEQVRSGAGLDAQRAAIEAEADRRGWQIIEWHTDEGLSGSLPADERPGMAAALETVTRREAAALIVAKSDRLARSVHTLSGIMLQADADGWTLTAVDGSIDTSGPSGRFMTHIMASAAELERNLISARTRDALAAKRAAGVRLGRPSTLSRETVTRIIRDREAGATLAAIAGDLTAEGIPTARGGARWYPSTVTKVLQGQDAESIRAEIAAEHAR